MSFLNLVGKEKEQKFNKIMNALECSTIAENLVTIRVVLKTLICIGLR